MNGVVSPLPLCTGMTSLLRRDLDVYFRPFIYPILSDIAVLPRVMCLDGISAK